MKLKKLFALALAAASLTLALTGCGSKTDDSADNSDANTDNQTGETVTVKLGVVGGIYDDLWAPAKEALAGEGIEARVVDMRWVKPLDAEEIARAAQTKLVVTVEGGIISGGVGEAVLGELARQGLAVPALTLGIPDTFVPQGSTNQLLHDLGLDAEGIAASVQERLAR